MAVSMRCEPFALDTRVAVVTGGSSGIGRAMAGALARAGAAVVVVARGAAALQQTVHGIEAAGGRAAVVVANLAGLDQLSAVAVRVAKPYGPPDILVNAAGVNLREAVDAVTVESWNLTLSLNLSAPFFLARALVPAMRARGWGRIINIASLQSVRAFPDSMPYGASKGGLCQLTRAMAEAWSRHGVNCNAIAPGFFPTALTAPVFADPDKRQWAARHTAVGRNGELADLHGVTLFLATPASDYVTGQTIFVDGGFSVK
jgi:NAD(P)-dependent dehydrogenase (short-subunit alcohol dehydrogenase family)